MRPSPRLRSRGLVATSWSAADILSRQVLQLSFAVVLARLLTPQEFGTVALLSLFVGLAAVVAEGGFGIALIQRRDITQTDESSVFWINVVSGTLLALVLSAISPLIARFYADPDLEPLTLAYAITVLVGSLGAVHVSLLTRHLEFKMLLKIGVIATALSGGIAIALAAGGAGIWSLAAQAVSMSICSTSLLWILSPWRPTTEFSRDSARALFGFGGYMLAANISDTAFTRLNTLLIGKWYGARDLGFYNRADTTQQIPGGVLSAIVSRVTLPLFSATSDDLGRLREGIRVATRSTMLINVPVMLGLASVAQPFVTVVFGTRWSGAAPILQVLCLGGVMWPLHVINLNLLMAQGLSRLVLQVEIAKKSLGLVLIAIGASISVMGIAWAYVVFGVFAFFINAHYSHRYLRYGAWKQIRDTTPILLACVPMVAAVYVVARAWTAPPAEELIGLCGLGGSIFVAVAASAHLGALHDVATAIKGRPLTTEEARE